MWYEDLSECDYLTNEFPVSLAIGWLEIGKPYATGEVSREVVAKIYEFIKIPEIYISFRGYYECDFCDFINIELGMKTLSIGYKNKVYICPALIVHYIKDHHYLPPSEFIEAVLNYDHQQAVEYFGKIRENNLIK